MLFSIFRVLRRCRHHLPLYILLALQIAFGSALMIYSLNSYFMEQHRFEELTRQMAAQTTMIETTVVKEAGKNKESIRFEDYEWLKKNFEDQLILYYSQAGDLRFLTWQKEKEETQLLNIQLIFISEEEASLWLGIDLEGSDFYAGDGVFSDLARLSELSLQEMDGSLLRRDSYFNLNGSVIQAEPSRLSIAGMDLPLRRLPKQAQEKIFSQRSYDLLKEEDRPPSLRNAILIPLRHIQWKSSFWPAADSSFSSRLLIQELAPESGAAWKLLDALSERHKDEFQYRISDQYLQTKTTIDHQTMVVKRYLFMSLMSLLLSCICNTGVFYLILLRRKKDIAISVMAGSTQSRQALELLLEIFWVVLSGFLIGFFTYALRVWSLNRPLPMQTETLLLVPVSGVAVWIASAGLLLSELRHLSPIEILQQP